MSLTFTTDKEEKYEVKNLTGPVSFTYIKSNRRIFK